MRLVGSNRASAPWFLNMVNERRPKGWSRVWTSEKVTPASDPLWSKYSMRADEFQPYRRLKGGKRQEYRP